MIRPKLGSRPWMLVAQIHQRNVGHLDGKDAEDDGHQGVLADDEALLHILRWHHVDIIVATIHSCSKTGSTATRRDKGN